MSICNECFNNPEKVREAYESIFERNKVILTLGNRSLGCCLTVVLKYIDSHPIIVVYKMSNPVSFFPIELSTDALGEFTKQKADIKEYNRVIERVDDYMREEHDFSLFTEDDEIWSDEDEESK